MKIRFFLLSLGLTAAAAFAQNNNVIRWLQINGVTTAPGVDNPVGGVIRGGAGPWTTKEGNAQIDLSTGDGFFEVKGLVLNGGNASGTPGPINTVVGTLVCNAGAQNQTVLDTPATDLSPRGDAELTFRLNVPSTCDNPLFLIRIPQANLRWIATGAIRVTGHGNGNGN